MQRVTGGKALTETGRGRIRAAVGLPKWVSIRRRQTGGGGLAAGAMGYLPQGDCGKIRPNPPTITILTNLTGTRGSAPLIGITPLAGSSTCLSTSSSGFKRARSRRNPVQCVCAGREKFQATVYAEEDIWLEDEFCRHVVRIYRKEIYPESPSWGLLL